MDDRRKLFLDSNILIRLYQSGAPLHHEVRRRMRELDTEFDDVWISRQVIREYCSVLSRSQTYARPLSPQNIAHQVKTFETSYYIADENAETTAQLLKLMLSVPVGGKQIHDANIVATMLVYGVRDLYTLNIADFERFLPYITLHTLTDDETSSA